MSNSSEWMFGVILLVLFIVQMLVMILPFVITYLGILYLVDSLKKRTK
jgi:hypothetical protein